MAWLLDTNVLSEQRKRERCAPRVREWFESVEDVDLFTSVLVTGEIRRGIEVLRMRDAAAARALDRWLRSLEESFAERVLPVTLEICDCWGRLCPDQPLPPIDGLLAATALHHRLTLVTRNVADVARTGVDVFNPFAGQGGPPPPRGP